MGGELTKALSALATGALLLAAPAAAFPFSVINGAEASRRGETTELRFAITARSRFRLSQHGSQLWIDLERTRVSLPPRPLYGREPVPITTLRVVNLPPSNARILMEVTQKTDYAVGFLPGTLLVRLAPAGRVANIDRVRIPFADKPRSPKPDAATKPEPADDDSAVAEDETPRRKQPEKVVAMAPAPVLSASAPERAAENARVVIDPGHGGHDPGTEAAGDVAEKTIALQISKRVATALHRRGISSMMTRDDDTFLSLAERTQLANRENADLFVSIHLNSSPSADAEGIEVYYLNNTTDRATIRLAKMENAMARDSGAGLEPNLNYILSDLRQQYKASESALLAQLIEEQTVAILRDAGQDVRGLGAKKGPFYVLVGAHMPAVLVECGFMSNQDEASRLESSDYQTRLAEGIATAIVHYLNADVTAGTL